MSDCPLITDVMSKIEDVEKKVDLIGDIAVGNQRMLEAVLDVKGSRYALLGKVVDGMTSVGEKHGRWIALAVIAVVVGASGVTFQYRDFFVSAAKAAIDSNTPAMEADDERG